MSSEQLEDFTESRESNGSGRYWRNYKEMDRYEKINLITGCYRMWEREIEI